MKILKAHPALNVRDVERSIEFYRKLLGIEPSKVRTGYAMFDVQNPPLNLTLNQHTFNEGRVRTRRRRRCRSAPPRRTVARRRPAEG